MKPAKDYILNQPEHYRSIIYNLQIVIENQVPDIELMYKWKIPFYYYRGKPFCFINVSHKRKYVDLGIVKGFQIKNHHQHLVSENRSIMKSLRYSSLEEIDNRILEEILQEISKLY